MIGSNLYSSVVGCDGLIVALDWIGTDGIEFPLEIGSAELIDKSLNLHTWIWFRLVRLNRPLLHVHGINSTLFDATWPYRWSEERNSSSLQNHANFVSNAACYRHQAFLCAAGDQSKPTLGNVKHRNHKKNEMETSEFNDHDSRISHFHSSFSKYRLNYSRNTCYIKIK